VEDFLNSRSKSPSQIPLWQKNKMVLLPVSMEVPAEVLEPGEIEWELTQPTTLFGRARFSMVDEFAIIDEEKSEYISREPRNLESDGDSLRADNCGKEHRRANVDEKEKSEQRKFYGDRSMEKLQVKDGNIDEGEFTEQLQKDKKDLAREQDRTCINSSKDLNRSLKQLYRSRNVPVPRPLPSLVELMEALKRAKIGDKSSN
jgi:hypothetical protein